MVVIRLLATLAVFASIVLIVSGSPRRRETPLAAWRERREKDYSEKLSALFISDWTGTTALAAAVSFVAGTGLVCALLTGNVLVGVIAALIASRAPSLFFDYLRHSRQEAFEGQLIDGLELLANAVKAGQTLPQAMAVVAEQSAPPLGQEFGMIAKEYRLGVALDRALVNARDRVASRQLNLAVSALLVNREKGGNLPETLSRISASMREINRLEQKIQAATAEGRKSARTMAAMPLVIGGMLYLMDPESMSLLFTDTLGNLFLLATAALMGISFWWIRRIVNTPI